MNKHSGARLTDAERLEEVRRHTDYVRRAAEGRWLDIFSAICPGMFTEAMDNLGKHVTCPFHGGANDFRFLKRGVKGRGNTRDTGVAMCTCGRFPDGFAVLQRATGARFYDLVKDVDEVLHGPAGSRHLVSKALPVAAPRVQEAPDPEELKKISTANGKLWDRATPLSLDVTPYYLARGISREALEGLQNVRQLGSLPYFVEEETIVNGRRELESKRVGNYPAILCQMLSQAGEQVALHRTWLSRNQKDKANAEWKGPGRTEWKAKKLTKSTGASGAAIRLHDAVGAKVLGIAEGVETALSARDLAMNGYWAELEALPVWASYAERNIRSFEVPDAVLRTLEKIVIFADNDKSGVGLAAAKEFQTRAILDYPHLVVDIKVPPTLGDDWNDELVKWRALRAKMVGKTVAAPQPSTDKFAVAA